LEPEWKEAAGILKSKGVMLAKVDSTQNPVLTNRFAIKGYPTIRFFENGKDEEYTGGRKAE